MKIKKMHELKILPTYFIAVKIGLKNFEIRKNDRDYKIGDVLILKEFDNEKFTGDEIKKQVKFVIYGPCYGLEEGYCIMSLGDLTKNSEVIESMQKHPRLLEVKENE